MAAATATTYGHMAAVGCTRAVVSTSKPFGTRAVDRWIHARRPLEPSP